MAPRLLAVMIDFCNPKDWRPPLQLAPPERGQGGSSGACGVRANCGRQIFG
jgi:hypothetical protein